MAILTADEVAELRAMWVEGAPDSCIVQPTSGPSFTTPCALVQPFGGDGGGGGSLVTPADITIMVPFDVVVPRGSTITVARMGSDKPWLSGDAPIPGTYDPGIAVSCVRQGWTTA